MARTSGRSIRLVADFVVVFLIAGVVAALFARTSAHRSMMECSLVSRSVCAEPGPGQDVYVARLRKDEQSLDRGVLTYSPIGSLKAADTTQFEVVVTDVGRGPQHAQFTKYNGMTVYQQDVPTEGIVGVQIVGCENLTWQQQSSPKQPVLARGDFATWDWQITAGMPGPAKIILRVDTYDQGSEQILHEEILRVNAEVMPSPAYKHQQRRKVIAGMAKSIVGDIVTIGSVATAILAIGGVVGWVAVNRRNRAKANRRKKDESSQRPDFRIRRRQVSNMPSWADHRPVRRLVRFQGFFVRSQVHRSPRAYRAWPSPSGPDNARRSGPVTVTSSRPPARLPRR